MKTHGTWLRTVPAVLVPGRRWSPTARTHQRQTEATLFQARPTAGADNPYVTNGGCVPERRVLFRTRSARAEDEGERLKAPVNPTLLTRSAILFFVKVFMPGHYSSQGLF